MSTSTEDTHTFAIGGERPTLYIPPPECSHCAKAVAIDDDGATCNNCGIFWPNGHEDEPGQLDTGSITFVDEGGSPLCGFVPDLPPRAPYDHAGKRWTFGPYEPCTLLAGHASDHLNPHQCTTQPIGKGL